MIERDHPNLSVGRQCRPLSLSRLSFCYWPAGKTELNLGLMRLTDEQFLETPFDCVRRLTRLMVEEDRGASDAAQAPGTMPICHKPGTRKPAKGHK